MLIQKDDAEKAMREILLEKLAPQPASADKAASNSAAQLQSTSSTVNHLMEKFFKDTWEYMDAANEGFIEKSRIAAFVHKMIGEIKLDDEEENLLWKTK